MVGITAKILSAEIRRQQQLSKSIMDGQTAISTGITLNKPSDDALAWVQVSDIARSQAEQAAWKSNISTGQARASKAESNLSDINNLMTRAQELMVRASSDVTDSSGLSAIAEELKTIRLSVNELVNEKDYQGLSVFDDQQNILAPVGRGLNLPVVGTRQSVSEGIDINGTSSSLDDILANAINVVTTGTQADRTASLGAVQTSIDHIVLERAKQGVRADRLDVAGERLVDVDLTLTERRQSLESTDLSTVIADVQSKLLQLQAAQTAFARINQQSLFDLIN